MFLKLQKKKKKTTSKHIQPEIKAVQFVESSLHQLIIILFFENVVCVCVCVYACAQHLSWLYFVFKLFGYHVGVP